VITRDRSVGLDQIGGFLALRAERAAELGRALRERGVFTDHRGDVLRLGPAPYLSDRQLEGAIETLGQVARSLG
jgi:kynureninase